MKKYPLYRFHLREKIWKEIHRRINPYRYYRSLSALGQSQEEREHAESIDEITEELDPGIWDIHAIIYEEVRRLHGK